MKLSEFKVGDHLEITSRSKSGDDTRSAIVTAINYNDLGLVTFTARYGTELLTSGAGAFDPTKLGTTPFGLFHSVKIVGHTKPRVRAYSGPRPGDRAYDLMC
jgi:hypothetical protein